MAIAGDCVVPAAFALSPDSVFVPAVLPSLFFGPPADIALLARSRWLQNHPDIAGERGRRAVLVCRSSCCSDLRVFVASESLVPPSPDDAVLPWADQLLQKTSREDFERQASGVLLCNGQGATMTLLALVNQFLEGKPIRIARGGAAGLNLTREHIYRSWLDALAAPSVQLFQALNNANTRYGSENQLVPVGYLEWWEGKSPIWDLKHNGMPLSPRTTIKPLVGWLLQGYKMEPDPRTFLPTWIRKKPKIVLEAADFVAVEKPSGLLCVPGTQGLPDALTLTEKLCSRKLTAVHRLDTDTSGLVLFAASERGVLELMAAFREKRVRKQYWALLSEEVKKKTGVVELPITTNPLDRLRQIVAQGGRPSTTIFRVQECWRNEHGRPRTLVSLMPETGRTHQLRVHCAHPWGLNAPMVGDPFYGAAGLLNETPQTPLCLHASKLVFPDPAGGRMITLESEPDWEQWSRF